MGHLGEGHHEDFVGDGFANGNGELIGALLKFPGIDDALHGNDVRCFVWHLHTNGSLARNGGNDSNAERTETQGDVVFEITDFADSYTRCRRDFVKRDGGADGGLDANDFHTEIMKHFDDTVFVGILLNHVYRTAVVGVFLQKVETRELVVFEVKTRIVWHAGNGQGGRFAV